MADKLTYEFIKSKFECRGYELVSKEYHNNKIPIEFKCNIHPEKIQIITYNSFILGRGCKICGR